MLIGTIIEICHSIFAAGRKLIDIHGKRCLHEKEEKGNRIHYSFVVINPR